MPTPPRSGPFAQSTPVGSRRPAYAEVADRLKSMIEANELLVGERLPSEPELAGIFAVSRSTIREALRSLSSIGLVVTARGTTGGSFVARPQLTQLGALLETNVTVLAGSSRVSIDELMESRELLEVPAAGLAAVRRSDDDLAVLDHLLHRDLPRSGHQSGYQRHRRFHAAILDAAGNRLLSVLARPVFAAIDAILAAGGNGAVVLPRADEDHAAITAAIRAGDPDAAATAMRQHLWDIRDGYRTRLSLAQPPQGASDVRPSDPPAE